MTSPFQNELELLRAANPVVSLEDLPPAQADLYERLSDRPPRRSSKRRLLVVATAASVIAIGFALLPAQLSDQGRGDVVELALAAVSDGPVIHAVVEGPSEFAMTLVDLESGETTAEALRAEVWFDQEREQRRSRVSIGETVVFEGVGSATMFDPALAGFTSRYRDALENGAASVVGEATVDGRRAVLLRITLNPGGLAEEVAVDAEDYRPLQYRFVPGPNDPVESGRSFRVVSIETIARDPDDFTVTGPPGLHGGIAHREGEVTVAEASTALGRRGLWPGRTVQGVELGKIERFRVETRWLDGRKTEKPALTFSYGSDLDRPRLEVTVGTSAEGLPLIGPSPHQRVPEGKLRLTEVNNKRWFGALERDGLHFRLESSERELVLAAAEALMPLG